MRQNNLDVPNVITNKENIKLYSQLSTYFNIPGTIEEINEGGMVLIDFYSDLIEALENSISLKLN